MNTRIFRKFALVATIALTVSACGGSDNTAGGGTGGTGISFGAVTAFGSIFVNGVEFSTGGATIRRDDLVIPESQLRRGMTVEVQGTFASSTSGTATMVTVEEAVRGPVEALPTGTPATGATLTVLGQTVHVDNATIIDNNVPSFAAIAAGMLLEVHGPRAADGSIAATFVEKKNAPIVFAVRGMVGNHNAVAKTFTVGALTVNYASAAINDMPAPSGSNWNNLFVEVKGAICAASPVCGTLTASKVEPDGLGVANAANAEIEGFVTALVSTSDFTVNSQRVVTTGSTQFLGGVKDDIVVGAKLEVEGTLAGGVLTAARVKFKESVRLESNAIVTGSTLTLEGIPGVTVTANAFTEFKNTAANIALLNGRHVRIRGRASGPTSVIATEIEDRGTTDPNGDVILQGSVAKSDVTPPSFKILGVVVNTTGLSPQNFEDVNDNPIGSAAFFNALSANGGLVKAKGQLPAPPNNNAFVAGSLEEVELED